MHTWEIGLHASGGCSMHEGAWIGGRMHARAPRCMERGLYAELQSHAWTPFHASIPYIIIYLLSMHGNPPGIKKGLDSEIP